MRTRTIYNAMSGAYRTIIFTQTVDAFLNRKARQWAKFERELLRRMDERDAWHTMFPVNTPAQVGASLMKAEVNWGKR